MVMLKFNKHVNFAYVDFLHDSCAISENEDTNAETTDENAYYSDGYM